MTATAVDVCDREELAQRVDGLRYTEAALSDAIAWTWTRLRDAGATDRGSARRAVTVLDDEGAPSERAVNRLWTELRELGAERKRTRAEVRELRALLETPPPPPEAPTVTTRPTITTAWVGHNGEQWVCSWQTPAMPEPQHWLYATQDDAECAAAAMRGETVAPLPSPDPAPAPAWWTEHVAPEAGGSWGSRPTTSMRTEAALYAAAAGDETIMSALYGPPVVVGDGEPFVTDEEAAKWAAEEEAQNAERAAKFAELVAPAYKGRLLRLPGETGRQYRRRKRIRPTPETKLAAAQLSAAYLRELRRLHDSGVLGRAETRRMMGLEPPEPWWRRVLFGAQDTADRGGYAP